MILQSQHKCIFSDYWEALILIKHLWGLSCKVGFPAVFFICSYSGLWERFQNNKQLIVLALKEHVALRKGCKLVVDSVCCFHLPACSFTIPHAGGVSHPHPPLINQTVITAVQLFLEHTSCESHSFLHQFLKLALPSYFISFNHVNMTSNNALCSGLTSAQKTKTQAWFTVLCICMSVSKYVWAHIEQKKLRQIHF